MAVVRNLMIRIGADYSGARKTMQSATRDLGRFKNDTTRTTSKIKGSSGLGGITAEFKNLGSTVTSSLSRIRGTKGIGGVVSELRTLRPVMGTATKGLGVLGGAAAGAGGAFGGAALGVGAFVAILGVATAGIYAASQAAVKFEADIGRLNISLREGSRGYMEWARAQGLAKQSAAELGATYGNLLGSFISDTSALTSSTQDLVHATRVISSYTGRTLDDVFNRIRSGMLGSTEAIEDLGVYVNISMIESTKAFRKFAGDKSWSQLDFQTQQQIRLAAILEQTYARYGNKLQANVMTKQERMLEQFKDVKLHLSQAFLPIWDSVLPALTRFSEALADVTEQLARFTYWIRGWDYDEMTSGTDRQTDAVDDLDDSLQDTEKSAKKAYKALAAFDQLNLIGETGGTGSGGSGGSGGGSGRGPGWPPSDGDKGGSGFPPYPPLNNKKWRIEFDPPHPPDAGIGAVATAVISTVNGMIAEAKLRVNEMWNDLRIQTQVGVAGQLVSWGQLTGAVGSLIPTMALNASLNWQNMWNEINTQTQVAVKTQQATWQSMWENLQAQTAAGVLDIQNRMVDSYASIKQNTLTTAASVQLEWKTMLAGMLAALVATRPQISTEWSRLKLDVESLKDPLNVVKEAWNGSLSFMHERLQYYQPLFKTGWQLVGASIKSLIPDLDSLKVTWATTLADMYANAMSRLSGIIDKINSVVTAWGNLKQAITGAKSAPATSPTTAPVPAPAKSPTGRAAWADETPVIREIYKGLDWLADATSWTKNLEPYVLPGAGLGGAASAGRGAATGAAKYLDDAIKGLKDLLKGTGGISIPAFASGAAVFGPTLAMVGDNHAASMDPEIIAPQSMMIEAVETAIDNDGIIRMLQRVEQAVRENKNVQAVISRDAVTRAAIHGINDETRRTGRNPLNI